MAAGGHFEELQMAITQQHVIRLTSCLVLGWGFQAWRIERHHFRVDQIQDRGRVSFSSNSVLILKIQIFFVGFQFITWIQYEARVNRPTSEPPFLSVIHCPEVQN